MKDIRDIRAEIDALDAELVRLFRRRLEITADVAASKRSRGAPVADPARERDILARVAAAVEPEFRNGARLFFSTLFGLSRARQRRILLEDSPLVRTIRAAHPGANRFSVRMDLPSRSDALTGIIAEFASFGIRLVKLDSRPVPGVRAATRFTFDFQTEPDDPNALALLAELSEDPEVANFVFLDACTEK